MPPLDKVYDYSQYGGLKVEKQDKVMTITLNAPESMNAFSAEMHYSMSRIWEDVHDDPEVNVVVLTGAGRAFSAGGNVIAMQQKIDRPELWDATSLPEAKRIIFRMLECDKPVIARVNGHAVGLGATVALMCDIIIAADTAKFGQPEITIGTMPGFGGTQRLPRAVGKAKAMEWCLTGRMIDAHEAERGGLVARVVPAADLESEALATAARIASFSLPVVLKIKEAINRAYESSLSDGLAFERREFHATFALEDQKEGMRAFVEKRKPQFRNR